MSGYHFHKCCKCGRMVDPIHVLPPEVHPDGICKECHYAGLEAAHKEAYALIVVGTKLRGAGPRAKPAHVRGIVDGLLIIRWWGKHKQRWFYECVSEEAIYVGLWRVEGT